MSLRSSMTLSEAGREVLRIAREYWPSIAAAAVLGAGSLVLFAVLRRHEDAQIRRVLELEGRYLSSAAGRSLETRVLEVVELARRSEGYTEPDSARWARDVQALADRDPALRAFEWRDAAFQPRLGEPLSAGLAGAELDSTYEADRVSAAASAGTHPGGWVAASFSGPGRRRLVVFAAPMLRDGSQAGVLTAIARERDLIDASVMPEVQRGFAIAVRDGPYRVYGPPAPRDWSEAAHWWRTTPVRVGGLGWAIDFWPSPELLDRLHSYAPPFVLVSGLLVAMVVASLIRLPAGVSRLDPEQ